MKSLIRWAVGSLTLLASASFAAPFHGACTVKNSGGNLQLMVGGQTLGIFSFAQGIAKAKELQLSGVCDVQAQGELPACMLNFMDGVTPSGTPMIDPQGNVANVATLMRLFVGTEYLGTFNYLDSSIASKLTELAAAQLCSVRPELLSALELIQQR